MGGVVAYEMAQQLRAIGQNVRLLALVETWLPVVTWGRLLRPSARASAVRNLISSRLRLHVQTLARLRGRRQLEYVLRWLKLVGRRSLLLRDWSELDLNVVAEANRLAFGQYKPREYPGPVVLFRAAGRKVAPDRDPRLAWSRLATGGLEIHTVPGDDSGLMLTEPHVRVLARELTACIERA
jgi:thioesterase domain-containing protein